MTIWVNRLSTARSGAPEAAIDADEERRSLVKVAAEVLRCRPEVLDADDKGAIAFLSRELTKEGRLRQGWGVPGLRLTSNPDFLANFVIAMRKHWGELDDEVIVRLKEAPSLADLFPLLEGFLRRANGRFKILFGLTQMRPGDTVLVPNVPDRRNVFAVATIAGLYSFEERTALASTWWQRDFGHTVPITDVRFFDYSEGTLLPTDLSSYRRAVTCVKNPAVGLQAFLER